ncbi:hypothetical protein EG68_01475 [Paragonimus skrjabini miyazakii]|uniref:EF-hand domain-containing protein n=1 Tax=Paragonimus skrjabini miyazakii TaxID=59628 RepID=A0A8S9Z3M2_9TREM|nr:hypothetical protein EG68_01475 [Paragonimus skrjabini miyazakii]
MYMCIKCILPARPSAGYCLVSLPIYITPTQCAGCRRKRRCSKFSVLDTNKDGKASVDELKTFLDSADCKLDKKLVQQFIDTHDQDKDGKLDLNELAACLSQ